MNLPKFKHLMPSTLNEAVGLLNEKGEKAKIIAGGTDLIVAMKQRTALPDFLINIERLKDLDSIRSDADDNVIVGSLTTLDTISRSERIREQFKPLAQAAGKVASMQIRNVGTIGGNICLNTRCWYYNQSEQWRKSIPRCFKMGGDRCLVIKKSDKCNAVFLQDTVPALTALDAVLKIFGKDGERMIPIREFYNSWGHPPNLLGPKEILAEVHIPKPAPGSFGIFLKDAPREVLDFALVNIAILITFRENDDVCEDARIVVGGVTSYPVKSVSGEDVLKGEKITDELINKVAEIVIKDSALISPIWVSPNTRRHMIKVFIKRGLQAAREYGLEN